MNWSAYNKKKLTRSKIYAVVCEFISLLMSDIVSVPRSNPRAFEEQFIDIHEALGMKPTSNSGAFWGDGDGRPKAKGQPIEFGFEGKVRFKSSKRKPAAGEMSKAMMQLRKFSSETIRLFGVYSAPDKTYAVSIPNRDDDRLRAALSGGEDPEWGGTPKTIRRRSEEDIDYMLYEWLAWKALYNDIQSYYD
jgi:hypothetical protein